MEKQPKEVYWVVLSDMVNSKKVNDRPIFSKRLKVLLSEYPKRFQKVFLAPPVSSKGIDEISAIVEQPEEIPRIIIDLAINLYPQVLRFAVAEGEISPISKIATEADGPAFHEAAKQLKLAEREARLFKMARTRGVESELAQAVFHQALTIIASWPDSTAEMARTKWKHPDMLNNEIAQKYQVTPQAVSKNLRRSRLDEINELMGILTRWYRFPRSS